MEKFINSEFDLVKSGKSEYILVVPTEPDHYEDFAVKEFKRLFSNATGIELPVMTDENAHFDTEKSVISLGRTLTYKESGVAATYDELKRDGYKIVTKGKTVILIGGGTYGTVYAVYGFMEKQFGYRYYAIDEEKIDKKSDAKLIDFDWTNIPDIENRTGRFFPARVDADCAIRMRTMSNYGFFHDGKEFFGSWAHNHIKYYIPIDTYFSEHPEWFSPERTQLCLSNEEMWDEMVERVKGRIMEYTEAEYFLLGQEDQPTFCGCPRCTEQIERYGRSGIMMRFINYVARAIKAWQKEVCPERIIYIGTFAYQKTQEPPVTVDENGNFSPVDPSVVPEDNVFIMIAPMSADCSITIDDPEHNAKAKLTLEGWHYLTDHCVMWAYCSNFNRALGFFDNFHVIDKNYRIFKKYEFKWVYYESHGGKQGTAFQQMLLFIHSNLAWDTSLNTTDLIDEFMPNFYKIAAPKVKQYFLSMDKYYKDGKRKLYEQDGIYRGTYLWNGREGEVFSKKFYSFDFLKEMYELLNSAINDVEFSDYDESLKNRLIERIALERMTIKFLIAEFFESEFDKKSFYAFIDEFESECERYQVKSLKQGYTVPEVMNAWKKKL